MIDGQGVHDANRMLAGAQAEARVARAHESWAAAAAAAQQPGIVARLFRRLFRRG